MTENDQLPVRQFGNPLFYLGGCSASTDGTLRMFTLLFVDQPTAEFRKHLLPVVKRRIVLQAVANRVVTDHIAQPVRMLGIVHAAINRQQSIR